MLHDDQTCAALPMTQLSITAWYCHAHQCWDYVARKSIQTGDDELTTLHHEHIALGPFDDHQSLCVALTAWLAAHGEPHLLEV